MPKSLADGNLRFVALTEKPADPTAPTITELNAGIDLSASILESDFTWGATSSDTVSEKSIADEGNATTFAASNYQASITLFRMFDTETGQPDETEDVAFQTVKAKGTSFYGYLRESGKKATDPWAAGDEVDGLLVITDTPQRPTNAGGFIKRTVPLGPQKGFIGAIVAAAAG